VDFASNLLKLKGSCGDIPLFMAVKENIIVKNVEKTSNGRGI
jgi:hypothetical protein